MGKLLWLRLSAFICGSFVRISVIFVSPWPPCHFGSVSGPHVNHGGTIMTQAANGTALELKRIVRMLDRAVEMAQDAELTGSLSEKSAAAVRSYNSIVTHLLSTAQISTALFEPLPADANLTDVAMASAQLAECLRAGLPEEEQHERRGGLVIGNLNLGGG